MHLRSIRITGVTGCLIAGILSGPAASVAVPLRTVVLTDEQAPGFQAGVVFAHLDPPDINNDGRVAFTANFGGSGVTQMNDDTLWSDRTGALAFEAREGAQAVGAPMMVRYMEFGIPILNDEGRLAFSSRLDGVGVDFDNDYGLFSEGASGILGLVAREGDQAAGTPAGVNYSAFTSLAYNNDGRVIWHGGLKGTGVDLSNNSAVWTGYPGSVSMIVRDGSSAPDLPAGTLISFGAQADPPAIGSTNQCVFKAGLSGATVNNDNNTVIYSGLVNSPTVLIRKGDPAPGAPAGVVIGSIGRPTTNASGAAAFFSFLEGAVDPSNDRAIFAQDPGGSLNMIARDGDPAPGVAGGIFKAVFGSMVLSAGGSVAFPAILSGPGIDDSNDECICSDNTGTFSLIAREGDRAPGTAEGVVFAGDAVAMVGAFSGLISMNAIDQVLFRGRLEGPGVDDTNRLGIWQHDPNTGLRLIVRQGDAIEVAPGDTRIIDFFVYTAGSFGSGGSDGFANALNDIGQFAFWASFADGSEGVFVTEDSDGDGTVDAFDNCPITLNADQSDSDGDGVGDACDACPDDADKVSAGTCGCGVADDDSDGDGTPDCFDDCPNDANKIAPGACGCGQADVDTDGDLILDCNDNDPNNPNPGQTDNDGDGVGDTPPSAEQCCGGGMPAMMPFMLLGWRKSRKRRRQSGEDTDGSNAR